MNFVKISFLILILISVFGAAALHAEDWHLGQGYQAPRPCESEAAARGYLQFSVPFQETTLWVDGQLIRSSFPRSSYTFRTPPLDACGTFYYDVQFESPVYRAGSYERRYSRRTRAVVRAGRTTYVTLDSDGYVEVTSSN